MAWQLDPGHTYIGFTGRHMMVATVHGEFTRFEGELNFDEHQLEDAHATVRIDAASVTTRNTDRDTHFRSADFFDVENHPTITFQSKQVLFSDNHKGKLVGDLTIRGITREVSLGLEYTGVQRTPWDTETAGFLLRGTVNRKDWGMTWNAILAGGGLVASDEIGIVIDLELTRPAANGESVTRELVSAEA